MPRKAKPTLKSTKDYDIFEMHPMNRNLHGDKRLLKSMQDHGFMPSSPLQCVQSERGKLRVIRGHNRLANAKRLSLPVYYVVDDSCLELFDLEQRTQTWSVKDFAEARAKAGDKECAHLLSFQKKHGLSLSSASALVSGGTAGRRGPSANVLIKSGNFSRGDMKHARLVVKITDLCRELGLPFAVQSSFVAAVSAASRVPGLDHQRLSEKLRKAHHTMAKRTTREEYLSELESAYNYMARSKRFPLAFRALETMRGRVREAVEVGGKAR